MSLFFSGGREKRRGTSLVSSLLSCMVDDVGREREARETTVTVAGGKFMSSHMPLLLCHAKKGVLPDPPTAAHCHCACETHHRWRTWQQLKMSRDNSLIVHLCFVTFEHLH